ncbi:MAG: isoprenylcysteine carboxylmethyltransferase family protein [Candidatus Neomarinimicrobiota bacterium]
MNTHPTDGNERPAVISGRIVVRWLVRETIGVVLVGVLLFYSAGRLDWVMGWALVAITAIWVIANALVLIPRNPDLLAERLGPKKGAKRWDTIMMSFIGLAVLARLVVAGLDLRYGWTEGIPLGLQVAALVIAVLGYALGVWALAVNSFFSQIVRIQEERDHRVVTSGPYRFVRHPGYTGTILFELAVPVMLGSWWAFGLGVIIAILFIIRTTLEDKTLLRELAGYDDYARQTSYRLLPPIW